MLDLIPDIISELLFMPSDCHSLQGSFDCVVVENKKVFYKSLLFGSGSLYH